MCVCMREREREREEDEEDEKGHTINKLCTIVLLLVLNYYVLSYFISFNLKTTL